MENQTVYEVNRLREPEEVNAIVDNEGNVIATYDEDGELSTPSSRSVFFDTLNQANVYREEHLKRAKDNIQDVADYLDPFFCDIDHVRKNMKEVDSFPWPLNKMINDRYQKDDHASAIRKAYAKMMRVMTSRFMDINGFAIRLEDIKTVKWCASKCIIMLKYKPEEEMCLTVQNPMDSELLRILFNNDGKHLFSDNYQAEEG